MSNCEICGKHKELNKAIVEGVVVNVCDGCSKFGKIIVIKKSLIEHEKKISFKNKEIPEGIIDNYSEIIKQAREKKGLKQEELAKSIAEKESVISKVETGDLKPSFGLAKKLEQFLSIKLIEIKEEKKDLSLNFKDSSLTIGDILKLKHRKF